MKKVQDFVAGLTKSRKSATKIKKDHQCCSWYCCRCCCQSEERLACHLQGYHLCLWGYQMGQSATFSKKTKGWSRNGSFTRTKFWSLQLTSCWCGWPPTRSSYFSTPPICWIWLLRPSSSSGVWRRCWLTLSRLWRASRRSGKGSAETLTLTSLSLLSGGSWTAATSALGSTMDKPRNLQK